MLVISSRGLHLNCSKKKNHLGLVLASQITDMPGRHLYSLRIHHVGRAVCHAACKDYKLLLPFELNIIPGLQIRIEKLSILPRAIWLQMPVLSSRPLASKECCFPYGKARCYSGSQDSPVSKPQAQPARPTGQRTDCVCFILFYQWPLSGRSNTGFPRARAGAVAVHLESLA